MKNLILSFTIVLLFLSFNTFSQGIDFGDAPDPTYPTYLGSNGAHHFIVPFIYLGFKIDQEPDGQQSAGAVGDDVFDGNDDEDGIIFTSFLIPGQTASITAIASTGGSLLHGWIDFNGDGTWADPAESLFPPIGIMLQPGYNYLTFSVPGGAMSSGNTYARFRYTTHPTPTPMGLAPDGEVEDYYLGMGQLTTANLMDPDPTHSFVQNEISMTLLPYKVGSAPHIFAAYNDQPYPGGPGLGVSYSDDLGATWNVWQLPYPNNPFTGFMMMDMFDPTITVDDSGHVFVGHISADYSGGGLSPASGMFVQKSVDTGKNWTILDTISFNLETYTSPDPNYRFNDRCQIAADRYPISPYYNNIYVAWIKDRGYNMPLPESDIYFSFSNDGGTNFSQTQRINELSNNLANMPIPDVASDGTVYVSWLHYDVTLGGTGDIYIDKSTDGGVTWGTDILVKKIILPPLNLTTMLGAGDARAKGAPVLKVLPSNPNILFIVYAADPDTLGPDECDIFMIKSTDGGNNWGPHKRVNDDATTTDQFLPWMYIKPNDVIDIAWYDRRNDNPRDSIWEVFFTFSLDFGSTINANMNLFVTPFGTPINLSGRWMGEYLGLVADYSRAYVGYTTSDADLQGDVAYAMLDNPFQYIDWGDAPDSTLPSYSTLSYRNGAHHLLDGATWMGQNIDADLDGQPDANASGDDSDGFDDEDGVTFTTTLTPGQMTNVTVNASVFGGSLNAWMDYNADGDWADGGEQIFTDQSLTMGNNFLNFTVPGSATSGATYCRFRFSTQTGLTFIGRATDGEVEDYQVTIEEIDQDWGDAPDPTYPTWFASTGASHIIVPGVNMGPTVDADPDGQPNGNATGDDNDGNNDDDGVLFSLIKPAQLAAIVVNLSVSGYISAWIDYNIDGDWIDAGEAIVVSQHLPAGLQGASFIVPPTASLGQTFIRIRFSTVPVPNYTGQAPDGEVEDYMKTIEPPDIDWGDAPDPLYPTLAINNGARHYYDNINFLGSIVDFEADGIPDAFATGDDLTVSDDEDGVSFTTNHQAGTSDTLTVTNKGVGYFNAWIDFNADGDWADAGEQIYADHLLIQNTHILPFTIPDSAKTDTTFIRCRFTTYLGIGYDGLVLDGEVEDYKFIINENMSLVDTIINGEDTCYYALNTIYAPKQGGKYVIESGGDVTLVAGQKIYLKPGFHAKTGCYFNAYIGTGCPVTTTAPVLTNIITYGGNEDDDFIQIYPIPTSGEINVSIRSSKEISSVHVELYSLIGMNILNEYLPSQDLYTFDLSGYSKGIYIIRVMFNDQIYLRKIIKH